MAISRMQQPRQQYGLGSIVKKAVRGVKKIVKSPLGKMALLGTAANFAPMLFGKGTLLSQAGGLGGLKAKFMSGKGFLGGVGNIFGKEGDITKGLSMGRVGLGALGAASIAPLFMGGDDEVEETVEQIDPAAQVQRARNFYSGLGDKGVGLNFMPKKKYVSQNFYAANGGRANFAMGGDTDDEDEVIRMQAATRFRPAQTFLNMGGGAGNAQAEQMLMAEFVKYKNKGGDLSFEQFVKQ